MSLIISQRAAGRGFVVASIRQLVHNPVLLVLFLVNLCFALHMNMVSALLPLFLNQLGADALAVGLVISLQGLVSTVLMIPSGLLSNRWGGRRMLVLSGVTATISLALHTTASTWQLVLPWALLYGTVFSTFIITRMTLIAEHSSTANRARMYGWMNITWSISNTVAPLLAGLIVEAGGWVPLFLVASFLAALTLPFIARLPADSPSIQVPTVSTRTSWRDVLDHSTLRVVALIAGIQLAMCMGMGVVSPVLPLYLTTIYAASPVQVGIFLSLGVGVATILTQLPSGLLADRYGGWRVLLVCAVVTPVLYVVAAMTHSVEELVIVYMAINGAWSMTWPSSMAHLVNAIPPAARSLSIGIRQTAVRLGFTLGPFLGGVLWSFYEGGVSDPWISFYVAAACFGCSVIPLLLLRDTSHI